MAPKIQQQAYESIFIFKYYYNIQLEQLAFFWQEWLLSY